ncbi:phytase [Kribbella capetownensis]|uniref:Phytase n=1 Tax=Kribbella capetownensis TaxID=1572659 RepID=A0A4R0K156_9ACTN|nr:phytase [Kribbella capetownensis]TCC53189.1 phytase [Kribbella capetownensis]
MRIAGVTLAAMVVTLGVQPAYASGLTEVTAVTETVPNWDDEAGGNANADDPAIWIDAKHPERSVVLGTLKNGGLTVFDLSGQEVQHIATPPPPAPGQEPGRFNNVDLVGNLAVVTDRGRDQLRTYAVKAGRLTDVTTAKAPLVFSKDTDEVQDQHTAYGLAATEIHGQPVVAVTRRSETRIGFFRLVPDGHGKITYRPIGNVDLPSSFRLSDGSTWSPCEEPGDRPQLEGMVFDRTTNDLYAAQEDVGVWRIPQHGKPELVEKVREYGQPAAYDEETEECAPTGPVTRDAGKYLSADAEGLTIAYEQGKRIMYASGQGDSTFASYRMDGRRLVYRAGFQMVDGSAADGVQHSDGAAVTTQPLGPRFPHGLFAVHDGENTPGDGDREGTNFKLVRLEKLP